VIGIAKLLESPTALRRFHAGATWAWLAMIPIAAFTGLKDSVPFLISISLWALVGAHWAAWQSVRAEQQAKEDS
jgi:hypothetical protein